MRSHTFHQTIQIEEASAIPLPKVLLKQWRETDKQIAIKTQAVNSTVLPYVNLYLLGIIMLV